MIVQELIGMLFCLLAAALAVGQIAGPVPAPSPSITSRPVPVSHLYYHFLMGVLRADRIADQREQQGRNADGIRNSSQRRLGFTDEEFAPIRTTALRLEAEVREIDAQAKTLIDADHAEHPLEPETRSELQAQSEQHKAEFESEVGKLRQTLGPSLAKRLDVYVQTHIDPEVKTSLPQPPSPPDANWQAKMFSRYAHFLRLVTANDHAAAKLEQEGRDGAWLRNSLQRALNFDDEEFALIRATAQRVEGEDYDSFAKRHGILHADPSMQTYPPELKTLSQRRESTIQNEVSELQHALGPDLSARLDEYIHAHYHSDAGTVDLRTSHPDP
jgi:hypothetical protein